MMINRLKGITVMFPFFKNKTLTNTIEHSRLRLLADSAGSLITLKRSTSVHTYFQRYTGWIFKFTVPIILACPQSVYSHGSIYPPTAATWDQLSWPIRNSSTCPLLDPNNAFEWRGDHKHIFAHREFGYCFYRHYIAPNQLQSGPLASANNNGQSDECPRILTGQPINIVTGNKFFSRQDFLGEGLDPLELAFYYNANSRYQVWTTTYTQKIIVDIGEVVAQRADGRILSFIINDGVVSGQSHYTERLELVEGNRYQLVLKNGTVERYDRVGQLLSIQFPSGVTHNISRYQDRAFIRRQSQSFGMNLTVTEGKVVKATIGTSASTSTSIQYEYEKISGAGGGIDLLTKITYSDNSTKTYLYENTQFPHYITGILDENNNRISSVQYDTQGRAISSEMGELNSGIERSQIEYHEDGTSTVTNALGKQNIYHFTDFNGEYKMTQVEGQASENCASANQAYTYDTNGFMASKTDWKGNITSYIHNDRGLETSRTEASGTPETRTITTEWHATFNLRTKVTEPERETVFIYDPNGRLLSRQVQPRSN
jgi:YD repeat-containing protein